VEGFTRKQGHFIAEAKVHSSTDKRTPHNGYTKHNLKRSLVRASTPAGESLSHVSGRSNEHRTTVARNTT
ncbi:hypothetical protein, partial [Alicyclobacillus hesperidum]|uniref:hypothetical protein n=1 Tax=Alicyclobacillus hesperidum TaxID=89784 RepID=UPI0024E10DEC